MLRKILVIAGIIILVISSIIGYRYIKKQRLPEFDVYTAIPMDANLIIEADDFIEKFRDVKNENEIWSELQELPAIQSVDEDLSFLLKLYNSNQIIKELASDNQIVISAHTLGKSNIKFLFLLQLNNFRDKKNLLQTITKLTDGQEKIESRKYNNIEIFNVRKDDRALNFAFNRGVLMFSSSSILLENSIRQMDAKLSVLDDQGFIKVKKTSGKNVDANIYLNLSDLNELVANALNNKLHTVVEQMSNIGDWAELDINIKEDAILLNGFSYSNDSLNNYLNLFLNQEAVDHKMNAILPSNTAIFTALGISNTKEYLKSYKSFLGKQGRINHYQLFIDQYKNKYDVDLEFFFKTNLNEEVGIIVTDVPNDSFKENTFVVMRAKSKSICENELEKIITKIAKAKEKNKSTYISEVRIDKETKYTVYSLPINNLFRTFFGEIFPEFQKQYVTFIDNYLLVSSSKNSLTKFIHSNVLQKTLENDMKFNRFTDYLSSKSNFYFYTNLFNSPKYLSDFLNPNLSKQFRKYVEVFKKFQALAVQFQQNNEMIYNNIYLQYIPTIKEEAITVWQSHLDTTIKFKPVFVTNHYTKENEIFVQDLNNKIYLINKVGRILWSLQLNEKINSDIYQADYYKNGKLQLLFSTKNKLHLIDRNGNYVERYPIKLRSPATAGMALFDYDKSQDYRIFIPCQNKKMYVYGMDGNLINGWTFGQTDTWVRKPVQHFRVKTNDYLVFADKYRVYILNRRGEERINVQSQFAKSKKNSFILDIKKNNKSRFVTTDTSGLVKFIYLNGTVESKQIGHNTANHFFDYQDINADGFKDYIFLDGKMLNVYNYDGDKMFDYKFDAKIKSAPAYYYFSYDDRKIGVVSEINNEIYLFNGNGSLYDGFPLKGNTPFTIGYLGNGRNQFNLIVGTKYNFLYNYSVN